VADDLYELYAIRYATNARRRRGENLMHLDADDPHDAPMPIDFFVWAAVGRDGVVLVDTGTSEGTCRARGHDYLRHPKEGLAAVGIDVADIHTVVTTHLHYDHSGNLEAFPDARLHVQHQEVVHACGPSMGRPFLQRPYDAEQFCDYVRAIYGGRVAFHDGDDELAPGLSIHRVGGHTPGMQVVRVNTRRGHVVLASDSMHYYENLHARNPFPILVSTIEYIEALEHVSDLGESDAHLVPGHDPAVLARYPAVAPDTEGVAVRLDVAPTPSE
jgi:glyoxylase-like metal-dependent hydrolase (beta-lactamase superfamily II)